MFSKFLGMYHVSIQQSTEEKSTLLFEMKCIAIRAKMILFCVVKEVVYFYLERLPD